MSRVTEAIESRATAGTVSQALEVDVGLGPRWLSEPNRLSRSHQKGAPSAMAPIDSANPSSFSSQFLTPFGTDPLRQPSGSGSEAAQLVAPLSTVVVAVVAVVAVVLVEHT